MKRRHANAAMLLGLAGIAARAPAATPNRIFIGFPPGGSLDYVGRLIAEVLRKSSGEPWIVEGRPGAGGRLVVGTVKAMPADGSAVLLTASAPIVQAPHLYKRLPYDPLTDLLPLVRVCKFSAVLVVGAGVPSSVKTFPEFVAWAHSQGPSVTFGTPAAGSPPHLGGLQIGKAIGLKFEHVPYKGAAAVNIDLLGGHLPAAMQTVGDVLEAVADGRLRALGTTSATRSTFLPHVPTFAEMGYAGLDYDTWIGTFAPPSTPTSVADALARSLREAVGDPAVQAGLKRHALEAANEDRAAFASLIQREHQRWGEIIRSSGVTVEE